MAARTENLVLVVERSLASQEMLRPVLDQYGYRADFVQTVEEAVRALERSPYGATLIQCDVPCAQGCHLAQRIRTSAAARNEASAPLVAILAAPGPTTREKYMQAGFQDCLTGPLEAEPMARAIAQVRDAASNPVPIPHDTGLFDQEDLLARMMGHRVLAQAVAAQFLEDVVQQLDALTHAAAVGDVHGIANAAHALKGASGNAGSSSLAALSGRIETISRDGQVPDGCVAELRSLIDAVRIPVAAFVAD